MQAASVSREQALDPEEQARADWYALLAVLFQQPPNAALLRQIASAPTDSETALGRAFANLVELCADADPIAIKQEYDTMFFGVGRPEVFLQASYYLTGFLHERPLASLRERLLELGLARGENLSHTEDHLGVLCELMRLLISGTGRAPVDVAVQRDIFGEYISPCYEGLCAEIENSGTSNFYLAVARLAREFFAIERQAFDFLT
jgi:TorA maturation chaperone TorD